MTDPDAAKLANEQKDSPEQLTGDEWAKRVEESYDRREEAVRQREEATAAELEALRNKSSSKFFYFPPSHGKTLTPLPERVLEYDHPSIGDVYGGQLVLPYFPSEGITIGGGQSLKDEDDGFEGTILDKPTPMRIELDFTLHTGDGVSNPTEALEFFYRNTQGVDEQVGDSLKKPVPVLVNIPGMVVLRAVVEDFEVTGQVWSGETLVSAGFSVLLSEFIEPVEVTSDPANDESQLPTNALDQDLSVTDAIEGGDF